MGLSAEEKILVAEYVGAGLIAKEVADHLLSGRVTKAQASLFRSFARVAGGMVARGIARAPGTVAAIGVGGARLAGKVAMRHPVLATAGVVYIAYQNQDEIRQLLQQGYELIPESVAIGDPGDFGQIRPGPMAVFADPRKVIRAVSKANRAVRQGMKLLKSGSKSATGASPGKLPAQAFRTAVKAAGLANPKTRSTIGKAKTKLNKLAKKLRAWWKR